MGIVLFAGLIGRTGGHPYKNVAEQVACDQYNSGIIKNGGVMELPQCVMLV
jgi:hypothetical protein